MDSDEEDGLRAFALRVGVDADASPRERPVWVERDGARIAVADVLAEWREEERRGFRVRLSDGSDLLLYYVPEFDLWSGLAMTRGEVAGVRRAKSSVTEPGQMHE